MSYKTREEKASNLVLLGLSGALASIFAGELWVNNIVYDVAVTGTFTVMFVVGCVLMCIYEVKSVNGWLPKACIVGAFGVAALLPTEIMADWVALNFFGVDLPQVTPYYALPLGGTFILGLIAIMAKPLFASIRRRS